MSQAVRTLSMNLDKGEKIGLICPGPPIVLFCQLYIVYGKNQMEKMFGSNEAADKGKMSIVKF